MLLLVTHIIEMTILYHLYKPFFPLPALCPQGDPHPICVGRGGAEEGEEEEEEGSEIESDPEDREKRRRKRERLDSL